MPPFLVGNPEVALQRPLQPYGHVFVRRIPDFELPRVVKVVGEVRYPGDYVLRRKDERVREVLERAGGLTAWAFPEGFRMYRSGRLVNVDLLQVLRDRRHRDKTMLQPGASLVISEANPVVLEEAVNLPRTVFYRRGAPLDSHVANAGDYARNADKGRVHVRYANGAARVKSKFLFFTACPPEPESVVVAPARPEGEPFNATELFASSAQIAASMAALVASRA
jgi:hypothetical protein